MKQKYLEAGIFVGTHGIKGEVRVQPWCDSPEFLAEFEKLYLENGEKELDVVASRVHKNIVLMKISGVESIEAAESFRGKTIYIDRDEVELAEGSYFQSDLIGCKVFNVDTNELLGAISEVSQTGANDVWHIKKDGKEYLIPSIPDVVKSVDIENEKVEISPILGLFDDEN